MATELPGLAITLAVSTHVFVEPFTPPLPLFLCLIAAGLAIIVSFVLVVVFARTPQAFLDYPRINLLQWGGSSLFNHTGLIFSIQLMSVFLFALLVTAGFVGNQDPIYNLAPTFVWVIWWVGVAYVSAFFGDIWALTNPWKILFGWVEKVWLLLNSGKPLHPVLQYPSRFGAWPALVLFLLFAWAENIYGEAVIPFRISQMILVYSAITWAGMVLFGKNIWLQHGEAFSVAFGFLARFAPTEARVIELDSSSHFGDVRSSQALKGEADSNSPSKGFYCKKELNLRLFGSGLLNSETVSASQMFFILVLLATVTFDGFAATLPWITLKRIALDYIPNVQVVSTLGLLSTVAIFVSLYLGVCALMGKISKINLRTIDLGKAFVYTLIPIALAYHVAHFLLFLLIQGQLLVPLASDPLGFGWDLFGTSNYRLNLRVVSPSLYWLISMLSIVIGHIVAVFLGHSTAFNVIPTRHYALRSQFPMLVLMVGYTIASLWIITQPMYMAPM